MSVNKFLILFADWLGRPAGFWATMLLMTGSVTSTFVIGVDVSTYVLSVLAIILPSVILVAQHRDEQAIQAKLDELIRAVDKADNRLIGIEKED